MSNPAKIKSQKWSFYTKWSHLDGLDKFTYLSRHVGLAIAATPLVGFSIATLPISLPFLLMLKASDKEPTGSMGMGVLALPAMLVLAPRLLASKYDKLDKWMADQARPAIMEDQAISAEIKPSPVVYLERGQTLLDIAVKEQNASRITKAIAAGANPNGRPGKEPLSPLGLMCVAGNEKCVSALLAGGANPNFSESPSDRPLMLAGIGGSIAVGMALLDAGARLEEERQSYSEFQQTLDRFAQKNNVSKDWARAIGSYASQKIRYTRPAATPAPAAAAIPGSTATAATPNASTVVAFDSSKPKALSPAMAKLKRIREAKQRASEQEGASPATKPKASN